MIDHHQLSLAMDPPSLQVRELSRMTDLLIPWMKKLAIPVGPMTKDDYLQSAPPRGWIQMGLLVVPEESECLVSDLNPSSLNQAALSSLSLLLLFRHINLFNLRKSLEGLFPKPYLLETYLSAPFQCVLSLAVLQDRVVAMLLVLRFASTTRNKPRRKNAILPESLLVSLTVLRDKGFSALLPWMRRKGPQVTTGMFLLIRSMQLPMIGSDAAERQIESSLPTCQSTPMLNLGRPSIKDASPDLTPKILRSFNLSKLLYYPLPPGTLPQKKTTNLQ